MMRAIAFCTGLLFISCFIHGQTLTVFPSDTIVQLDNVDISSMSKEFRSEVFIQNETTDTLWVIWRREIAPDCPYVWSFSTGDLNQSFPSFVNTNYIPDEFEFPFFILPDQYTIGTFTYLKPRTVPGCCDFKMYFSELSNPDSILATANFDFRINDPNCDLVSDFEEMEDNINVFPNPVNNTVYFESDQPVGNVQVFNFKGEKVSEENNINQMDVSGFSSGIFIFKITQSNGKTFVRKIEKM
ncbi:MAG: T9SS type A sorting domain-containing protein [Bacteroidota bacterium]